MTDTITIPRWMFDELCERAGPPPKRLQLPTYAADNCKECGARPGYTHDASCSVHIKKFQDGLKQANG